MIKFEVLNTPEQQHAGLQHRDNLEPHAALVFTGIGSGQTFHSENCKFPFTIIALDANKRVLKASVMFPPDELWNTPANTVTVIEGVEDFCERYNIQVGQKFPFDWTT